MADQQNPQQWIGLDVVDPGGDNVGTVEDVYLDDVSGQPEWLAIKTGMFGNRLSFAPLAGATAEGDALRLAHEKSLVKDSPRVDADGHLEPDEEAALYAHYGRSDYVDTDTDAGVGTDDAMTRSEEEVQVGKRSRETGRARLRKYIVTENVQTTVPVQREEVRIEREAITDANAGDAMSGAELTEDEHEVVLHEEQPVVDKRVVPKERVRLDKDVVTDEQQVSEEVRKEQIEVEGDDKRRKR
jgi:uncharacterized protein (TIGR02271 family)